MFMNLYNLFVTLALLFGAQHHILVYLELKNAINIFFFLQGFCIQKKKCLGGLNTFISKNANFNMFEKIKMLQIRSG